MTSGDSVQHEIDPAFLALPLRRLADAALSRARDFGVDHADFRLERVRGQDIRVRDGRLQGADDTEDLGLAVRVVHNVCGGSPPVWCSPRRRRSE